MSASPGILGDRITVTLHHLVDRLDAHADAILRRSHGTTWSQFHFLAVLADQESPDVTTLAGCLGVTKAAVSKRLPSLVEQGWVTTSSDPAHGRRVLATLTPAGARLVQAAAADLDRAFTDLAAEVTDVDLGALHHDLTTLLAALNRKALT